MMPWEQGQHRPSRRQLAAWAQHIASRVAWERPSWRFSLGTYVGRYARRYHLRLEDQDWLKRKICDLHGEVK